MFPLSPEMQPVNEILSYNEHLEVINATLHIIICAPCRKNSYYITSISLQSIYEKKKRVQKQCSSITAAKINYDFT